MPAPLTVQQIALYMSKRRAGNRQEVAAAAALALNEHVAIYKALAMAVG